MTNPSTGEAETRFFVAQMPVWARERERERERERGAV